MLTQFYREKLESEFKKLFLISQEINSSADIDTLESNHDLEEALLNVDLDTKKFYLMKLNTLYPHEYLQELLDLLNGV